MLTMPKLAAGAMVAFVGWIAVGLIKADLRVDLEMENFGSLVTLVLVVGFVCGWRVLGNRASEGMGLANAIGIGLTAVAAMALWSLFLVSANEMLRLALASRYDGPVKAIQAMFPIMGRYGWYILYPNTLMTLIIGGIVVGPLADIAARRWN